jgi:hypothetical protein
MRQLRPPAPIGADCSLHGSPNHTDVAKSARSQLLRIFLRLAIVLELTREMARTAGKLEHHAALTTRLAIFRARVETGRLTPLLATTLEDFAREFSVFITVDLGCRRL